MSSTAEELASQAEHLQNTVEFFKVDGGNGGARRMAGRTMARGMHRTEVAHTAVGAIKMHKSFTPRPEKAVRRSGVALDMGNGDKDPEDNEFERF